MSDVFSEELLVGEAILWQGRPDPNVIFAKADVLMVPFSLIFLIFAIFFELRILSVAFYPRVPREVWLFHGIGLLFVLIGGYLAIGRFYLKKRKKLKTWYALTNKRALIMSHFLERRVDAVDLKSALSASKIIGRKGTGSIIFGTEGAFLAHYLGFEYMNYKNQVAPAFYDINNVEGVFRLIEENRVLNRMIPDKGL